VYLLFAPADWKAELKPCNKCNERNTKPTMYKATLHKGWNLCCNSAKYLNSPSCSPDQSP
jgi:hypothetical protein